MIRPAGKCDCSSILALYRDCITALKAEGIDQWDDLYPNLGSIEIDISEQTLFIFEEDGRILGVATINVQQEPEYAEIPWQIRNGSIGVVHRLAVHPDAQGKGIAKALMDFCESLSKKFGRVAIRLDAFSANPVALSFYRKLGYCAVGEVKFRKGQFVCFEKALQ